MEKVFILFFAFCIASGNEFEKSDDSGLENPYLFKGDIKHEQIEHDHGSPKTEFDKKSVIHKSRRTGKSLIILKLRQQGKLSVTKKEELRIWPNGRIPYDISFPRTVLRKKTKLIQQAMTVIENNTCIQFVPRTNENDYIQIYRGIGCASKVGKGNGGTRKVSLGKGCLKLGIVIHELVHSIGLHHEHNRSDRDNYITIHEQNIIDGLRYLFEPQKNPTWGPYDYNSIMHYGSLSFSKDKKNGLETMTAKEKGVTLLSPINKTLSLIDIEKINKLYECSS